MLKITWKTIVAVYTGQVSLRKLNYALGQAPRQQVEHQDQGFAHFEIHFNGRELLLVGVEWDSGQAGTPEYWDGRNNLWEY